MYTLKVNGSYSFTTSGSDEEFFSEEKKIDYDIQKLNEDALHVLYNRKSYDVLVISADRTHKSIQLRINNTDYQVEIADEYDELMHRMGFDKILADLVKDLKAPMPGLVLEVCVKEGQQISKGDKVVVLEAMKMENIIKSPVDGVIKSVKISSGDKIEKNQVMILF